MDTLRSARLNIEKGLYKKSRINVALDRAEKDKVYKQFKADILVGLFAPVKKVATEENVTNLLLFVKAKTKNQPLIVQISTIVAALSVREYADFAGFLVWAGTQGGQSAIDKLGLYGTFNLTNAEVVQYFNDYSNLLIDSVDVYTKEWIATTIQNGYTQGLSPKQIASKLVSEGKKISQTRAERIALTELANAMAKVESEASKRYGIEEHIWRTSRDEIVCTICLPLDGKQFPVDGDIDGYTVPAHPSCRCFYEDVIPDSWSLSAEIWVGE